MRTGAAAPVLRLRDVVPAAVVVVLLLGVAGCMGALGGGPLDVTPVAIGTVSEPGSPQEDLPAPAYVPAEPVASGDPTPEWFGGYAERLAESKRSGTAPELFLTRTPLFSCGEFVLGQGATVPQNAWDCLAAGVDGGAELVIVKPTTEGDPIISYFRVGPDIDGVDVFTDSSLDKFGVEGWRQESCSIIDAPGAAMLSECSANL